MELDAFITYASVKLEKDLTDEQKEFASDFTKPTLSISKPGTGKTTSAVFGLLVAELYHKVRGETINACSFTKAATLELQQRHEDACEALRIRQTVNFMTIHAMCKKLLEANCDKMEMPGLKVKESITMERMSEFIQEAATEEGIKINPYKIGNIVRAIRSLNAALIFDRKHAESKQVFMKTGLSYDDFTVLRKRAYRLNKKLCRVQMDDVLLYTLELLLKYPEVSVAHKKTCKILLVDEVQDMSLLQLKIASLLSDTVVAIGDMAQQIYAFNGACSETTAEFRKLFPDCREVALTHSFRCCDEIASYATSLIAPNKMEGETFRGNGKSGQVIITDKNDLISMCDKMQEEFRENNNVYKENIMFLFRNNFSSIPIAEELFKRKLPFRVNNYEPAHRIPIIRDFSDMISLIQNPYKVESILILRRFLTEFSMSREVFDIPLAKIMSKYGYSFMECNYCFKEQSEAHEFMSACMRVQDMLMARATTSEIMNALYPFYKNAYLNRMEHLLELPSNYYISLVAPLTKVKSYQAFVMDELAKEEAIRESLSHRTGIRCYTFHTAKGTEADVVHIWDADVGIVPNDKKLQEAIDADCLIDAARDVRNERCLVYVASTRAKNLLSIHSSSLSSLFTTENKYEFLDAAYAMYHPDFDDVRIFKRFISEDEESEFDGEGEFNGDETNFE